MMSARLSMRALFMLVLTAAATVSADSVVLGDRERTQLAALESIRGESVRIADLDGKAVVVTFFASWCPPCRTEFLSLNKIAKEFAGADLSIVAVNVFEDFDETDEVRLSGFLADTQPHFFVVEGSEEIKRTFGDVQRIPTVFIFDRSGQPIMHFIHKRGAKKMSVAEDELRVAVARALAD